MNMYIDLGYLNPEREFAKLKKKVDQQLNLLQIVYKNSGCVKILYNTFEMIFTFSKIKKK